MVTLNTQADIITLYLILGRHCRNLSQNNYLYRMGPTRITYNNDQLYNTTITAHAFLTISFFVISIFIGGSQKKVPLCIILCWNRLPPTLSQLRLQQLKESLSVVCWFTQSFRTGLCGGWCQCMALRNRELHARNDDDDVLTLSRSSLSCS